MFGRMSARYSQSVSQSVSWVGLCISVSFIHMYLSKIATNSKHHAMKAYRGVEVRIHALYRY
jgi:hypothetical protein